MLYAFQVNFKHWFVYHEQNDREPKGEVCKILVLCDPVDQFQMCKFLRLSSSWLRFVANYVSFSDLVFFQHKFNKSLQKKNIQMDL